MVLFVLLDYLGQNYTFISQKIVRGALTPLATIIMPLSIFILYFRISDTTDNDIFTINKYNLI
jgi:hypothetical protein